MAVESLDTMNEMKHLKTLFCTLLLFCVASNSVSFAASESLSTAGRKGKIIAKSALYGFGGGLVIGLASQVFKKKAQNVFMFGSLGLYAGIAMGLYIISFSGSPKPYEGPDTYEDFSYLPEKKTSESLLAEKSKEHIQLNLINLSF